MGPISKPLARLIAAAEAYGDAKASAEQRMKLWKRGDPPPAPLSRELESDLKSAARAYATSTRKKRSK